MHTLLQGDSVVRMKSSTFSFTAPDGVDIHVYKWEPEAPARAIVQLEHGVAEHALRYARLAESLTAAGFAVYANDHRGHGKTAKSDEELGTFATENGWARVLGDIHQLNGIVRRENPGLPVVVMGHSMGSFFVQNLLFAHPEDADAAVLSATTGKPPAIAKIGIYVARFERKRLGARKGSGLLHEMGFGAFNKAFKPNRTAYDWLSRDPVEVDKYIADKHCGFTFSTQVWIDLLGALDLISKPENQRKVRKDLPIYVFAGTRDPAGENTKGPRQLIAAYRAAGLTNIEHKFYDDARHETLNETNRDEVVRDLLAFLERAVSARAAKAA